MLQNIGMTENGMPRSKEDFKEVFNRLKDYKGEGSEYDLTDLVIEEMY